MILSLLKAFLIGICASAPIGPTAVLILQKSVTCGRKTGFVTALGATIVDTSYSAIAMIAVSFVESFILAHQNPIMIAGGVVVCIIGAGMVFKKIDFEARDKVNVGNTLQAACCVLANPGAIATMLALVTVFKIDVNAVPIWILVPCVALGSVTYWQCFTTLFSRISGSVSTKNIARFNMIAGIVVILLGVLLAVKGIINL